MVGVVSDDAQALKNVMDCLKKTGKFVVDGFTFSQGEPPGEMRFGVLIAIVSAGQLRRRKVVELLSYWSTTIRLIIMIDPDDVICGPSLLKLGIAGILLKNCPCSELSASVAAVASGKKYLSAGIRDFAQLRFNQKSGEVSFKDSMEELTAQEHKVLKLIADGLPTKLIAQRLGVSLRTVENHRFSITKKLGVKSVAGLTKFAIEHCLATFDRESTPDQAAAAGGQAVLQEETVTETRARRPYRVRK